MGMARAVGAKRRHLVQMFVFEGTAYALVSAAVGVVVGLGVATLMVGALNSIFSTCDDNFTLKLHFTLPTIIVSYCLGMVITFATVGVSAYRVSNLNIISAIRNLPDIAASKAHVSFWRRLLNVVKAMFRPALFVWKAIRAAIRLDFVATLVHLISAVVWLIPIVWIADILTQLFKLVWPYMLQGWFLILLGVPIIVAIAVLDAEAIERWAYFGAGVTLVIVGIGLLARTILATTEMRDDLRDRLVFTTVGITTLIFWALPGSTFEALVGNLQGDIDVMFVSGISMVGAAVWTVMYNADILLGGLQILTGRVRQLRPVMVTAVAYPLSAKFRTGLTLAMFALVVFTLMVMSVLTSVFGTQFAPTRTVTGGWDVEGTINLTTPIDNIEDAIAGTETLSASQFEAVGGYTQLEIDVREVEADSQQWHGTGFIAADDAYLDGSVYDIKIIADGYGSTPEEVFDAVRRDPNLVLIGGSLLDNAQGQQGETIDRVFNEVSYDDESMSPIQIEIREPQTRTVLPFTAIAIIDRIHASAGLPLGLIGSKEALEDTFPFPLPTRTYRFRVVDETGVKAVSQDIERSFLENGMETVVLEEQLDEQLAALRGFFRLFTGFMALGLFVGIAALGVVSTRAVVERRQQIGMLRALGYRRSMIQLSFLFESSFVALLGTVIGTVLGLILAYNAVADIRSDEGLDTIRFSVPWVQVGIILGLTYVFSLLATYLPARQASKTYPAEALRYE